MRGDGASETVGRLEGGQGNTVNRSSKLVQSQLHRSMEKKHGDEDRLRRLLPLPRPALRLPMLLYRSGRVCDSQGATQDILEDGGIGR